MFQRHTFISRHTLIGLCRDLVTASLRVCVCARARACVRVCACVDVHDAICHLYSTAGSCHTTHVPCR